MSSGRVAADQGFASGRLTLELIRAHDEPYLGGSNSVADVFVAGALLAAVIGVPLAIATAVRFRNTIYLGHADEPLWWVIWLGQVVLTYVVLLLATRLMRRGWSRRGRVSRSTWNPWNWE